MTQLGKAGLQEDVRTVRAILGIPDGQIRAEQDDPLWKHIEDLVKPGFVRRGVEGNLAGWWYQLHRDIASGRIPDREIEDALSLDVRQSAAVSDR